MSASELPPSERPGTERLGSAHLPPGSDLWCYQDRADGWTVAFRLVGSPSGPVCAELHVMPTAEYRFRSRLPAPPGLVPWAGRAVGLLDPAETPGTGIGSGLLRSLHLSQQRLSIAAAEAAKRDRARVAAGAEPDPSPLARMAPQRRSQGRRKRGERDLARTALEYVLTGIEPGSAGRVLAAMTDRADEAGQIGGSTPAAHARARRAYYRKVRDDVAAARTPDRGYLVAGGPGRADFTLTEPLRAWAASHGLYAELARIARAGTTEDDGADGEQAERWAAAAEQIDAPALAGRLREAGTDPIAPYGGPRKEHTPS